MCVCKNRKTNTVHNSTYVRHYAKSEKYNTKQDSHDAASWNLHYKGKMHSKQVHKQLQFL